MKRILLFILLISSLNTRAQKASLNENSVTYLGKTYKVGNIIHLGYGSGTNKEFAFVNYGKSIGGIKLPVLYHHADANWSKADVEIIKIYSVNGIIWAKCNPINRGSSISSVLGNKIFINIEAAVDNKEITGSDQAPDAVSTTKKLNTAPTPPAPPQLKKESAPISRSGKVSRK